jgi:hypothetical protein
VRTFLRGRVPCPLAGIGTRPADESNRLVVDAPSTQVTIDGATITIDDARTPAEKTVIADLVWLAEARGTYFTIHLELFKTGTAWSIDLHTHEPAPLADRSKATYEPFTIVVGERRETVVDPARLARAVAHVPLARRLSSALMTTRDHPRADRVVFDRSLGMGALGRGMFLVRARLARLDDGPTSGRIAQLLTEGTWELSLEALTDRWLPALVARDLVLFGVPALPLLADLRSGKLRKGQTLAFRSDGFVRVDGEVAQLPGALDLAREYLELHMLGGIVSAAVGRA